MPTPYKWVYNWNTSELWTPETTGDWDEWGWPRYPDGVYRQEETAFYGPNYTSLATSTFTIANRGTMSGVVKDHVTGLPVAGAVVEAVRYWTGPHRNVYATTTTNAQGEWQMALYPASYAIEAKEINYVTGSVSRGVGIRQQVTGVEILLDRRVVVDFTGMPPMWMGGWPADGFTPAHARATVRRQDGTPVPNGTQVTFSTTYGRLEPTSATTTIDGEGKARATVNLIPDPLSETDVTANVTAQADGATSLPASLTFKGVHTDLEIQVDPVNNGVVGGTVWLKLKVTKTSNVTLTALRLKYREDTQAHETQWVTVYDGGEPGMPFEQGDGWKTYRWQVNTTALHNFGHTLHAEAEFATTAPLTTVIREQTIQVRNVVVTNVTTSCNLDYIKYDLFSAESDLNNPHLTFDVEDAGDPHQYDCYVFFRPTPVDDWWTLDDHGNLKATYYYMRKVLTGPGSVNLSFASDPVHEPGGTQVEPDALEMGTYTFDIYVNEANDPESYDWDNPVDHHEMKTNYLLGITAHDLEFRTVGDETKAYASYTLYDEDGRSAQWVKVDLLDPDLATKASVSGPGTASGVAYSDVLLYTVQQEDLAGDWRAVFTALDAHGELERDHQPNRMLAVNKRTKQGNCPEIKKVFVVYRTG